MKDETDANGWVPDRGLDRGTGARAGRGRGAVQASGVPREGGEQPTEDWTEVFWHARGVEEVPLRRVACPGWVRRQRPTPEPLRRVACPGRRVACLRVGCGGNVQRRSRSGEWRAQRRRAADRGLDRGFLARAGRGRGAAQASGVPREGEQPTEDWTEVWTEVLGCGRGVEEVPLRRVACPGWGEWERKGVRGVATCNAGATQASGLPGMGRMGKEGRSGSGNVQRRSPSVDGRSRPSGEWRAQEEVLGPRIGPRFWDGGRGVEGVPLRRVVFPGFLESMGWLIILGREVYACWNNGRDFK